MSPNRHIDHSFIVSDARRRLGLSRKEFATRLARRSGERITPQRVRRWEKGKFAVPAPLLSQISALLLEIHAP